MAAAAIVTQGARGLLRLPRPVPPIGPSGWRFRSRNIALLCILLADLPSHMSEQDEIKRKLNKVLQIASVDHISVLVIAGCAVLLCLLSGYWLEAIFGTLACGAGLVERHGYKQVSDGIHDGFKSLIRSQLLLLVIILVYAIWRLQTADASELLEKISEYPFMQEFIEVYPYPELLEPVIGISLSLTYGLLIILSLIFQGGLAWWYARSAKRLQGSLVPPQPPQS